MKFQDKWENFYLSLSLITQLCKGSNVTTTDFTLFQNSTSFPFHSSW